MNPHGFPSRMTSLDILIVDILIVRLIYEMIAWFYCEIG